MTRATLRRSAAAAIVLVFTGCASRSAGVRATADSAAPATTTTPAATAVTPVPTTATPIPTTVAPATSTVAPSTAAPARASTTVGTKPPPVALGPEWTQSDGRVRIEATASGDPQVLLRDLQALGLRDGVVFGRVVNGWLPVEAFEQAQRLASLQLVRPTGAGTG